MKWRSRSLKESLRLRMASPDKSTKPDIAKPGIRRYFSSGFEAKNRCGQRLGSTHGIKIFA